jgi:hypothetical protein
LGASTYNIEDIGHHSLSRRPASGAAPMCSHHLVPRVSDFQAVPFASKRAKQGTRFNQLKFHGGGDAAVFPVDARNLSQVHARSRSIARLQYDVLTQRLNWYRAQRDAKALPRKNPELALRVPPGQIISRVRFCKSAPLCLSNRIFKLFTLGTTIQHEITRAIQDCGDRLDFTTFAGTINTVYILPEPAAIGAERDG